MRRAAKWVGVGVGLLFLLAGAAIVVGPPTPSAEAIANSVDRTPALMQEAWALPAASTYRDGLHWQSHGSTCGPASLVNVRRSLGLPAADEGAVLEGSGLCWTGMCIPGVTLDQLAQIALTQPDVRVTLLRDLTPEQFLDHLRHSNDPDRRYTINFSRPPIFGEGGGHHSPIAGYLESEDKVLVLDVNETFQPWLIERERLFDAMDTVDSMSEAKRGLLLIEPVSE